MAILERNPYHFGYGCELPMVCESSELASGAV